MVVKNRWFPIPSNLLLKCYPRLRFISIFTIVTRFPLCQLCILLKVFDTEVFSQLKGDLESD